MVSVFVEDVAADAFVIWTVWSRIGRQSLDCIARVKCSQGSWNWSWHRGRLWRGKLARGGSRLVSARQESVGVWAGDREWQGGIDLRLGLQWCGDGCPDQGCGVVR
mgnify:CR=1 FL=1